MQGLSKDPQRSVTCLCHLSIVDNSCQSEMVDNFSLGGVAKVKSLVVTRGATQSRS